MQAADQVAGLRLTAAAPFEVGVQRPATWLHPLRHGARQAEEFVGAERRLDTTNRAEPSADDGEGALVGAR